MSNPLYDPANQVVFLSNPPRPRPLYLFNTALLMPHVPRTRSSRSHRVDPINPGGFVHQRSTLAPSESHSFQHHQTRNTQDEYTSLDNAPSVQHPSSAPNRCSPSDTQWIDSIPGQSRPSKLARSRCHPSLRYKQKSRLEANRASGKSGVVAQQSSSSLTCIRRRRLSHEYAYRRTRSLVHILGKRAPARCYRLA